jgi:hypothetical protein
VSSSLLKSVVGYCSLERGVKDVLCDRKSLLRPLESLRLGNACLYPKNLLQDGQQPMPLVPRTRAVEAKQDTHQVEGGIVWDSICSTTECKTACHDLSCQINTNLLNNYYPSFNSNRRKYTRNLLSIYQRMVELKV